MGNEHREDEIAEVQTMYMTGGGDLVEAEDFLKSANIAVGGPSSRLEQQDDFDQKDWIDPPYNPKSLTAFLHKSSDHSACVKAKAHDTGGLGYDLVPTTEDPKMASVEQFDKVMAFLNKCNPKKTFTQIVDSVLIDKEATGNGWLEVARNLMGEPAFLDHAPSRQMRVRKPATDGYVQIVGDGRGTGKKIYFQEFGKKVVRGPLGEVTDLNFMNPKTGKPDEGLGMLVSANEVIHLALFDPTNKWYGIPDIIPAIGALLGNLEARDFNLDFFENHAVPEYAVVFKGTKKVPEDTQDYVRQYFKRNIKGKAHRALVIALPDGLSVEFKPLWVDITDASWQKYKEQNTDEIIRAEQVPPHRVMIQRKGSLGGDSNDEQMETYKRSVIDKRQNELEEVFTQKLIRDGFGFNDWRFEFADLDLKDEERQAKIAWGWLDRKTITVNEARADYLGKDPVAWGDKPLEREVIQSLGDYEDDDDFERRISEALDGLPLDTDDES